MYKIKVQRYVVRWRYVLCRGEVIFWLLDDDIRFDRSLARLILGNDCVQTRVVEFGTQHFELDQPMRGVRAILRSKGLC